MTFKELGSLEDRNKFNCVSKKERERVYNMDRVRETESSCCNGGPEIA